MLTHRDDDWYWGTQPLQLTAVEAALVTAMQRQPGTHRQPFILLARETGIPYAPATGRVFLFTLRRKLERASAPADLIDIDPVRGAAMCAGPQTDPERRLSLGMTGEPSNPLVALSA